ncbi:hypothetical protein PFISCL1PPCAC_28472, partial [Pristionchus fissidentatus]
QEAHSFDIIIQFLTFRNVVQPVLRRSYPKIAQSMNGYDSFNEQIHLRNELAKLLALYEPSHIHLEAMCIGSQLLKFLGSQLSRYPRKSSLNFPQSTSLYKPDFDPELQADDFKSTLANVTAVDSLPAKFICTNLMGSMIYGSSTCSSLSIRSDSPPPSNLFPYTALLLAGFECVRQFDCVQSLTTFLELMSAVKKRSKYGSIDWRISLADRPDNIALNENSAAKIFGYKRVSGRSSNELCNLNNGRISIVIERGRHRPVARVINYST